MYFIFLNSCVLNISCFYLLLLFRDIYFAISIYDIMIFIYNPKELKLVQESSIGKLKGKQLGRVVLSSALP